MSASAELIRAQAELSRRRADVAAVQADLERDKRNFERYATWPVKVQPMRSSRLLFGPVTSQAKPLGGQ